MSKYFKPTSLTWWSGVGLIILGATDSIQSKSVSPYLIQGMVAIGLRAAVG